MKPFLKVDSSIAGCVPRHPRRRSLVTRRSVPTRLPGWKPLLPDPRAAPAPRQGVVRGGDGAWVYRGPTRKVDDRLKALGGARGISKSEASRICGELGEERHVECHAGRPPRGGVARLPATAREGIDPRAAPIPRAAVDEGWRSGSHVERRGCNGPRRSDEQGAPSDGGQESLRNPGVRRAHLEVGVVRRPRRARQADCAPGAPGAGLCHRRDSRQRRGV